MVNKALYTISNKWIMRHDAFYGDTYALYNIETRKLARLTAPLYMLLHLFYTKAMSYKDIKDNLAEKGIFLKWDNVSQIEKEFGFEKLFIQSDISYHPMSQISKIQSVEVPLTSTPMDVELLLTHNCNLRCKHCFQSSELHSDRRKHLSLSEWEKVFMELEKANIYNVIISGGEPMMYPNFEELLRKVTNFRMSFSILTNGMLITEKNLDIFKKKNVAVTISLDGCTAEQHEFLRGKNTFNHLVHSIDLMVNNGVKLNVAHVVNAQNKEHLDELVCFLVDKGVRYLSINLVEPEGRASSNKFLHLTSEEEIQIRHKILQLQTAYSGKITIDFPNLSYKENMEGYSSEEIVFCSAGTKRVAISSDGCVYPCVYAFNLPFLKMGDLKKETLQSIWEKKDVWRLMRGGISISQIDTCKSCKLQKVCSMRNCRIKSYSLNSGLYAKPNNCLIDKVI